jgi:ATP-independent RNA helicase DbpA
MTLALFSGLPLSHAQLDALTGLGYAEMTPVQAQSLPAILARKDVIIQAKTGSGKRPPSQSVCYITLTLGTLAYRPW